MYDAFYPGQVWLDTNGNRIQAHGGSLIYLDGVYYWYGENKEKTDKAAGIWHWGVRYYASTDLYNWEDRGLLIPPVTDDPNSSLHPTSMMDRPHILYKCTDPKICLLAENYGERPDADRNSAYGRLLLWSVYHSEGKTAPTWYECG